MQHKYRIREGLDRYKDKYYIPEYKLWWWPFKWFSIPCSWVYDKDFSERALVRFQANRKRK